MIRVAGINNFDTRTSIPSFGSTQLVDVTPIDVSAAKEPYGRRRFLLSSLLLLPSTTILFSNPLDKPTLNPLITVDPKSKPSDSFVSTVDNEASRLPKGIQDFLTQIGCKIVVCKSLIESFPLLNTMSPRGWSAGSGWQNAPGTFFGNQVFVAEEYVIGGTNNKGFNHNPGGILRHELGHGFHSFMILPMNVSTLNASKSIQTAYKQDFGHASYTLRNCSGASYYLQMNGAGQDEAFAEIFASTIGGGALGGYSFNLELHRINATLVLESFPNLTRAVKKEIFDKLSGYRADSVASRSF